MHGSFFSGTCDTEHRLTDDDLHHVRRCMLALDKIKRIAELHCAEEAIWQLEQLIGGLQGILSTGRVLLQKASHDLRSYQPESDV